MRRFDPLFIFLAALIVHLLVAAWFPVPGIFVKYNEAAAQILSGDLPQERLLDFSPLYLWISLAAERFLPAPRLVLQGLQILMTASAAALLFIVLRRRVNASLAALGAMIFAVDRHTLVYTRILEPEALAIFLLCAFLFFVERVVHPDSPSTSFAALAGIFAGLSLATRPTFLPVFVLVPFFFLLNGSRGRRWAIRSGLFLLPVVLVMSLLTVRAANITGDPRTPLMSPGTVFFEGNNPLSHGTSAIYPPVTLVLIGHDGKAPDSGHAHYRNVARGDAGEELSIREVNAYWSAHAKRFLGENPSRAAELFRTKLTHVFHSFRWHDISTAWEYDASLRLPSIPFALIGLLALAGGLLAARRWERELVAYLPVFVQLGVMMVFYVSARQRFAIFPALLIFVVLALDAWLRASKGRKILSAVLLAALVLPLSLPNDAMRDETWQRLGRTEAGARLAELREISRTESLAKNRDRVVQAIASAPWWIEWMRPAYVPQDDFDLDTRVADALAQRLEAVPAFAYGPALFDLGRMEVKAGRLDQARKRFEELEEFGFTVYRGGNGPSLPSFYLGRISALQGDLPGGVEHLTEALAQRPGDAFALAEIFVLTGEEHYREKLLSYFSGPDALWLISRARIVHGREEEAAEDLQKLTQEIPILRDAQIDLAVALGKAGKLDEGAAHYLDTTDPSKGGRVEPLQRPAGVVRLFRDWAAKHPQDVDIALTAAEVLYRHGRLRDALALLDVPEEPNEQQRLALEKERRRLRAALLPSG